MQGLAVEIVGQAGDKGIDVLEVLASLGIRSEFPEDVWRKRTLFRRS